MRQPGSSSCRRRARLREPLGLVCVVLVPPERLLDARVQMLGQALDEMVLQRSFFRTLCANCSITSPDQRF